MQMAMLWWLTRKIDQIKLLSLTLIVRSCSTALNSQRYRLRLMMAFSFIGDLLIMREEANT